MPYVPMNLILDKAIAAGQTLTLRYPDGRNEGHFFGAFNHSLSLDGAFFRSPRDFTLITRHDGMLFTWHGNQALPAGALLNLQVESPGGDFYYDAKFGVTVQNMVLSHLFMVNLASPDAADPEYWVKSAHIAAPHTLPLATRQAATPRNVVIHAEDDNTGVMFVIEGEDFYKRTMIEHIQGSSGGSAEGKKAFAGISRITPSRACAGSVSIGTGTRLGLPVYLPSTGYLIKEIVDGEGVSGGHIVSGENQIPSATAGDRRGTYTPPAGLEPNGQRSVHLLLSLLAPGNIGIPDFAG